MEIYHDRPMDLADASLVIAAQTLKISRIFAPLIQTMKQFDQPI
ncbi:hypothetical protein [Candidatus Marithrix sp. Canyon 246]|nr:hypothetical protein [Candidatus Marithrix sp. Canyon 246]